MEMDIIQDLKMKKSVESDRGIGYWIGKKPKGCSKFYFEFFCSGNLEIFGYGYLDKKNFRQGDFITFYNNGKIAYKGKYENGKESGYSFYYNKHGELEEIRENGNLFTKEKNNLKKILARERIKNL
jgi:antitoxin component YwqK of YwqJK toxin-antitoxin module